MSSAGCLNACSSDCFSILYTARTKHQLRIKESLFISWLNPTLNEQKNSLTNATFLCPFDLPFPPLQFVLLSYSISDVSKQVGF